MNFHKGYKDIKIKLLNFDGNNIAKKCYEFGVFGSDHYGFPNKEYIENSYAVQSFIDELIEGTTFPKYSFTAERLDFSIEGISRICLAQLTRDSAIFCSESHGLRPLSMDFNIPLNLYNDESIMDKLEQAQKLLESAYIEACEKEYPYPETRYLGLHAQTISVNASYTISDFVRSCYSRTNNSFCDELNYVYRKMFHCIVDEINKLENEDSKKIWNWLISEKKCIDDNFYKRTNVFNGDFSKDAINMPVKNFAQNDWRNSCWKLELERIIKEEPYLLTDKEKQYISKWLSTDKSKLYSSYSPNNERVAKNAIKRMDYYEQHRK